MKRRASKSSAVAVPKFGLTLAAVPLSHFARFLDGRLGRVAAIIAGCRYVRFSDDAPRTGPHEMDDTTPVLEIIEPSLRAEGDRGEVVDPLQRGAA